jgi:hypothetical protein
LIAVYCEQLRPAGAGGGCDGVVHGRMQDRETAGRVHGRGVRARCAEYSEQDLVPSDDQLTAGLVGSDGQRRRGRAPGQQEASARDWRCHDDSMERFSVVVD